MNPNTFAFTLAFLLGFTPLFFLYLLPQAFRLIARLVVGAYVIQKTAGRKAALTTRFDENQKKFGRESDEEWENVEADAAGSAKVGWTAEWSGIVGFFHPFCNAGGGGERVLWGAILATQKRWPNARCVVYTGDHEVSKEQILERVQSRFNIKLHAPTIEFLYVTTRHWVVASTWPHFTLLGQSLGSMYLAWDAFNLLVPDIFVDTMGYAFALGLCKLLFPHVPTGAYVHYPTISTDMLDSLHVDAKRGGLGINAGKGIGLKGVTKRAYWQLFAQLYTWVGSSVDVVMTNSSWTAGHIRSLWQASRRENGKTSPITVVYPPVAVEEMEHSIEVSADSESQRQKILLYIAQFRPEKNHQLVLKSFAKFISTKTPATEEAKLVLIGSVRDDSDSKRVYELRLLVNELKIKEKVEFHLDAPWPDILDWLRKASVGVNGMWNEHFGIGVVEYQAAGLISVVHDSGGPKADIVREIDGMPTGFHATTIEEFAAGFEKALSMSPQNTLAMRLRARTSAKRFTDDEFAKGFIAQLEKLVVLQVGGR